MGLRSLPKEYKTFREFYPFYLSQHRHPICRRLHLIGSLLIIFLLIGVMLTQAWLYLIFIPIVGYSFAWAGHFFFEKNRPATFTYPLYSLIGDWKMFAQFVTGKLK